MLDLDRTARMIPPVAALAVAGLLCVPCGGAAAQTLSCPRFERPVITVERQQAPLEHDYARGMDYLTRIPGRAPGPAGQSAGKVLGLAHAKYGERSQIRAIFQPMPDGSVCGAAQTISIAFGFEERRLYVARELPPDTCIHREVREHEMKHVHLDDELLNGFLPTVERRLQATAARVGTVRGRSQEQVMTAIRQPVESTLRQLLRDFTRERDRRQAQIDTAEEYRRVTTACNGELSRYMPKTHGARL